jgi:hypothetical protein
MTLLQAMARKLLWRIVMSLEEKVKVTGASGCEYEFGVYRWGQAFKPLGGVYLVLKRRGLLQASYDPLYIGQTGDLSERFDAHHKQGCFDQHARTHIGVKVEASEQTRLMIERDLLSKYQTPCNY